jgi:hypothetical protein
MVVQPLVLETFIVAMVLLSSGTHCTLPAGVNISKPELLAHDTVTLTSRHASEVETLQGAKYI